MGFMRRLRLNGTYTTSGGAAQSFYTEKIQGGGFVESIVFRNGTASGLSTAGHLTISAAESGAVILSVSTTGASGAVVPFYPTIVLQNASGAPREYASGGGGASALVPGKVPIADEAIRVDVSSGGNASAGGRTFRLDFYLSGN